ncbi:two pore domain potassium channel family protein [Rubellimicrobium sp. CFH 75288]|uniref:two pore domain potassium channel family protein n=1 Tax=Rubellimicrobium sp. CFH 75288 TaxID=2697034 RepID=UPI0014129E07|nr:two pore domain potassium channel family protein [Rubellimicrobium sp. CFH 75288]NAZ37074.1 two pore domain potassium channel family protein [Rubellimicrobium sp. CFH 75288]
MLQQIIIGSLVTMLSLVVSGLGFWAAEVVFTHRRRWLREPPHAGKLVLVVTGAGALVLAVVLAGVTIWTVALRWSGLFADWETAYYYALASYTTVGYGDVVVTGDRRILGAMAAANGFINIGLLTTLLIEGLGHVREGYRETVNGREG